MTETYGTPEIIKNTCLSYRTLDYWLGNGYVTIAFEFEGSGNPRQFTEDEYNDMLRLAKIWGKAVDAGVKISGRTVSQIWIALQRGREWSLSLSTEE